MKYFTYDHNGDGFEYHNTEEEAKNYAQQCLDFHLQNDMHDFVDICWGEIKGAVHSNDAVLELKATNDMQNNKPLRVDQIRLVCSIMKEIDKQNNGCFLTNEHTNTIIKAANMICDVFNNKDSKKE